MEQLALHEGTSFLKQCAAWGCSAGCRSSFRTVFLAVKLCEVLSILVVRTAGGRPV